MVQTYKKSIHEIKGDKEWSALERELLVNCRAGISVAGEIGLPNPDDSSRYVRPELITYLLLGGCDGKNGARPTAEGVKLVGAYLTGCLEFKRQSTKLDLLLADCRMPNGVNLMDAALGGLLLQNCQVESELNLHRIKVQNGVQLRAKTKVQCGVNLGAARIGSSLDCSEGHFENTDGPALNCNGASIGADVFLSDGFSAKGEVDLGGAQIGGQLDCSKGGFENVEERALNCGAAVIGADVFLDDGFSATGRVGFIRANVAGHFHLSKAQLNGTVDIEAAQVGAGLLFHEVTGDIAMFDLTEATVGSLRDDAASWGIVKGLSPSGLKYDRIDSDMTLEERLEIWGRKNERFLRPVLGKEIDVLDGFKIRIPPSWRGGAKAIKPDFDPQPHTQLANVLEAQGDRVGAAKVRYEREKKHVIAARARAHLRIDGSVEAGWISFLQGPLRFWQFFFRWMFGYGHRPGWALYWTLGTIVVAFVLYGAAYDAGQMAPNSDIILASGIWQAILDGALAPEHLLPNHPMWKQVYAGAAVCADEVREGCVMPLALWQETRMQVDYETFNPFLYAVDLFVPLDALGQESTWTPSKDRGLLGWWAYWMRMPIQVMGWVIAAVGAAVVTGVIGRKDR